MARVAFGPSRAVWHEVCTAAGMLLQLVAACVGALLVTDDPAGSPVPEESATAAPRASPFVHQVRLDFGAGTPVGVGGVTYALTLLPTFALEAGAGYGFTGIQLSLMPVVSLGDAHRFVLGAGLSVGTATGTQTTAGPVVWLNIDGLGYAYQAPSGFAFTARVGGTVSLNRDISIPFGHGRAFPQARLGFGWSF